MPRTGMLFRLPALDEVDPDYRMLSRHRAQLQQRLDQLLAKRDEEARRGEQRDMTWRERQEIERELQYLERPQDTPLQQSLDELEAAAAAGRRDAAAAGRPFADDTAKERDRLRQQLFEKYPLSLSDAAARASRARADAFRPEFEVLVQDVATRVCEYYEPLAKLHTAVRQLGAHHYSLDSPAVDMGLDRVVKWLHQAMKRGLLDPEVLTPYVRLQVEATPWTTHSDRWGT